VPTRKLLHPKGSQKLHLALHSQLQAKRRGKSPRQAMMLLKTIVTIILLVLQTDCNSNLSKISMVNAEDTFNYHETNVTKRSFAPKDWNMVACQDVETCVRRPVLPKTQMECCLHMLPATYLNADV
jgi:hypothetical protein